jgi:PAS domain-containing protein
MHEDKLAEADFILDLFDALPEAITYLIPVFNDGKIVDFNIRYLNAAAGKYTGKTPVLMMGKNILEHQLPSVSSYRDVFDQSLEVYNNDTSKTVSYYNAFIGCEVTIVRRKFRNGVLSLTRSLTPVKA